jgi:predicted GIY-YIG superfamily endonuclease
MKIKTHCVYTLLQNEKPIYVGCTSDIRRRIAAHRRSRSFDGYIVVKSYDSREEALSAENAIIRFISILNDPSIENALFDGLTARTLY